MSNLNSLRLYLCAVARSFIYFSPFGKYIDIADSNPDYDTLEKARYEVIVKEPGQFASKLIRACLCKMNELGANVLLVNQLIHNQKLSERLSLEICPVNKPKLEYVPTLVYTMAYNIYKERDFKATPILADLIDEKLDVPEISDHLRSSGPHYRGCWAINSIIKGSKYAD